MAYRKTEKVLAHLEARRAGIIAAAIDVISRSGMEGLTTDAIAERGAFSVGLIFKYFPDMVELRAAVVAQLLARDIAAVREASNTANGLAGALSSLFTQMVYNYRLMGAIGAQPAYRQGMRRELARIIRSTGAVHPVILATVAYGAIFEAAGTLGPRDGVVLTTALLRAMDLPAHTKTNAVA